MRVLLAAVDAQKGDLDGNLARHLTVLDQGRAQGVVFFCSARACMGAAPTSGAGATGTPGGCRPGCLVVELAVDVTVHPVREAVRCLVVDGAGRACRSLDRPRWWSARELRSSATVTTPRGLPELLDRIAAGDLPDGDEDLGV